MPLAIARGSRAIPLLCSCVELWLMDRCKSGFAAPSDLVSAGGHADECQPLTWHTRAGGCETQKPAAASTDRKPFCHRLDRTLLRAGQCDAAVICRSAHRVATSTP